MSHLMTCFLTATCPHLAVPTLMFHPYIQRQLEVVRPTPGSGECGEIHGEPRSGDLHHLPPTRDSRNSRIRRAARRQARRNVELGVLFLFPALCLLLGNLVKGLFSVINGPLSPYNSTNNSTWTRRCYFGKDTFRAQIAKQKRKVSTVTTESYTWDGDLGLCALSRTDRCALSCLAVDEVQLEPATQPLSITITVSKDFSAESRLQDPFALYHAARLVMRSWSLRDDLLAKTHYNLWTQDISYSGTLVVLVKGLTDPSLLPHTSAKQFSSLPARASFFNSVGRHLVMINIQCSNINKYDIDCRNVPAMHIGCGLLVVILTSDNMNHSKLGLAVLK
ncbi:hypothetical protein C8F01DRAFT_1226924 [Mycena amicta]|nr:hypothetical protein C8F01DRAFT_1226924 [Mycena amicta]